jgi:hypothetical protein
VVRYLSKRPVSGLLELLDYLEASFDNYEIIIVELVSRRFKYLENKKNLRYTWLNHEHSMEDGAAMGSSLTSRTEVHISFMDGTLDFTEIKRICQQQSDNLTEQKQSVHLHP